MAMKAERASCSKVLLNVRMDLYLGWAESMQGMELGGWWAPYVSHT